jgi:hypothetical protein
MSHQNKQDLRLERIANLIADSEFELSDEELLSEIREVGDDPIEDADCTLELVRDVSHRIEVMNSRLAELGHKINLKRWRPDGAFYTNRCFNCDLIVRLDPATGKIAREALYAPCFTANRYAIGGRGGV